MLIVYVLGPFLIPEFYAVEEVVVALISDEVGEICPELGWNRDVSLVTKMPFSDPACPISTIVQSCRQRSGSGRDMLAVSECVRL